MRPTGYNIREGSAILAQRRAQREAERIEEARQVRVSFVRGWADKKRAQAA